MTNEMNTREASATDTIEVLLKDIGELVIAAVTLGVPRLTEDGVSLDNYTLYGFTQSNQLDKNRIFPDLNSVKKTLSDLLGFHTLVEQKRPHYEKLKMRLSTLSSGTDVANQLKTMLERYDAAVKQCLEDSQTIHSALKNKIEVIETEILARIKEPSLVDAHYTTCAKKYLQTKKNREAKETPIPSQLILDWNKIADLHKDIGESRVPFVGTDNRIYFTTVFATPASFSKLHILITAINAYNDGIQIVNSELDCAVDEYRSFKDKVESSDLKEQISELKNKAEAYQATLLTHAQSLQSTSQANSAELQIQQLHAQVIEAWLKQLQSSPSLFDLPVNKTETVSNLAVKVNTLALGQR